MGREARLWTALGALAVALSAWWMTGFTVDDALISIRYAQNVRAGAGWRFDARGPATDGVTPLWWPLVLAPLAHGSALAVLARVKLLGTACGALAGGVTGAAVARADAPRAAKAAGLAVLALSVPVGAWTASGMETPLAMLLATLAATRIGLAAAVAAGLAASLRPELLPWSLAIAAFAGAASRGPGHNARASRAAATLVALVIAAAPFTACALVRLVAFGRAAPLAVFAKPSDLAHGASYAVAAALASLAVPFAFAPLALARASAGDSLEVAGRGPGQPPTAVSPGGIAVAGVVHLAAIAAAGGDWMPYARLLVPIAPSLVIAGVVAARTAHPLATVSRTFVALALGAYLAVVAAPAGRRVGRERAAMVADAAPHLAHASRIAALDIGWLTAAAPQAAIVDLAGVTDPEIAMLHGGHTSKRIDAAMLLARAPDTLVLFAPPRSVEAGLAAAPAIRARFTKRAFAPLGSAGAGYEILTTTP